MAESGTGWRSAVVEDFQVLGGKGVVRVDTQRTLEAFPRVPGLAQPRERHAEVRPSGGVVRIEAHRTVELSPRGVQLIAPQEERPVVEPDARHTWACMDRLLEQRLGSLGIASVRKSNGEVVEVVGREVDGAHADPVSPVRTEPGPDLPSGEHDPAIEQLEDVFFVAGRTDDDMTREDHRLDRHSDSLRQSEHRRGQRRAVAAVSDQDGCHRGRRWITGLTDDRELARGEESLDNAAPPIYVRARAALTRRGRSDESVEAFPRTLCFLRIGERRVRVKERVDERRGGLAGGRRRRHDSKNTNHSQPNQPLNEDDSSGGANAND